MDSKPRPFATRRVILNAMDTLNLDTSQPATPETGSKRQTLAVVWRARALANIGRIVRTIATDNPIAPRRAGRELLLARDSLVTFPPRGRPGHQPGTRELVAEPPHIIVYQSPRINAAAPMEMRRISSFYTAKQ